MYILGKNKDRFYNDSIVAFGAAQFRSIMFERSFSTKKKTFKELERILISNVRYIWIYD